MRKRLFEASTYWPDWLAMLMVVPILLAMTYDGTKAQELLERISEWPLLFAVIPIILVLAYMTIMEDVPAIS